MVQKSNLTIGVPSIIGGMLTAISFLGFPALSSILRSETSCLIVGSALIITTLFINRLLTKLFLDVMNVTRHVTGCTLTGYGMSRNVDILFIVPIGISIVTALLSKRFILIFLSVVSFYMALSGEITNLFFSLNPLNVAAVSTIAILLFVNLSEIKILSYTNGDFSKYKPIHSGLFISCVLSLTGLPISYLAKGTNDRIISVFMLVGVLLMVYEIMQVIQVKSPVHRVCICLLCILICLPSLHAPYLSGSIPSILTCFHYDYKAESVVTLLLFIYSISKYYYDLGITLLTRSITLFFMGIVLFITWYVFTQKKIRHEKIQPNTNYC